MIEILAATNRPGSNTLKIARLIASMYPESGASAQVLDLQSLPPEIFTSASYAEKPHSFAPFQQRIFEADGLHIITPEYNGSFPGVLKYFIDMLKSPDSFEHLPVAFTSLAAGQWGGLRAVEQLQMLMSYRNAYMMPERVFIPLVRERFDVQGGFADPEISERLRQQTRLFTQFVKIHSRRRA